jgi:hypothetical protein
MVESTNLSTTDTEAAGHLTHGQTGEAIWVMDTVLSTELSPTKQRMCIPPQRRSVYISSPLFDTMKILYTHSTSTNNPSNTKTN